MLNKVTIRNFKRLGDVDIDLGEAVVFIGPNNAGKTSALQALALWDIGLRKWVEKRKGATPEKRPGVTINRQDLVSVPVPDANHLWMGLRVRNVQQIEGKPHTENVRIEVIVEGVTNDVAWKCGLEFDYANQESLYCRPLRLGDSSRMPIPAEAAESRVAYLPPMSGLTATETQLPDGAIAVRIGEGRTAEVLRNLCFQISSQYDHERWDRLRGRLRDLFGVEIERPEAIPERGEIRMTYLDKSSVRLDISASGRGLQQTLLLLAYLETHPGTVLLLDEPDAHLEILRQRQIYRLLTDVAREHGSQVIAASHSEVVLNEAADRDVVVAFVGKPHRIDDRGTSAKSQVLKSLKEIGFEQYYQAEQIGWVIYLEGATDLAILQELAQVLAHDAAPLLARPFVHYVGNNRRRAEEHFFGLQEAKTNLVGVAIFDSDSDVVSQETRGLIELKWRRREIENYIFQPEVLETYAVTSGQRENVGPLFEAVVGRERRDRMRRLIGDLVPPRAMRDRDDPWWRTVKATDEFLDRLFEMYFAELKLPNRMRKSDYHVLAGLVPRELIDPEVGEKLDAVVRAASAAKPIGTDEKN